MTDDRATPWARAWRGLLRHEQLNFIVTNRVPRIALTRLVGRLSRIRSPLFTRAAIAVWRLFVDLDLSEARASRFESLHACFTRELRPGARPVDPRPDVLVSPCDAIVGACGDVADDLVLQAKGFPYRLADLFGADADVSPWRGGRYVTLRLTSAMYHRFHAPCDARLHHVTYHGGDCWNVNPAALHRVERLYCRNERAVLRLRTGAGDEIALVPVAAILVATLRLHALDLLLHLRYRGPARIACDVALRKGDEIGWFEQGSTIIVFAPPGHALAPGIVPGASVRMGAALLLRPPSPSPSPRFHGGVTRTAQHPSETQPASTRKDRR